MATKSCEMNFPVESVFNYKSLVKKASDIQSESVESINNYDFHSNWKTVLELLKSKKSQTVLKFAIQEWIESQIVEYLLKKNEKLTFADIRKKDISNFLKNIDKNNNYFKRFVYSKWKMPKDYSADCMDTGLDEADSFDFELRNLLIKYSVVETYTEDTDPDTTEKIDSKYNRLTRDIFKNYINNCLDSYQIFHSCFTYGAVINLYLAKSLFPEDTWELISSDFHLTCVNKSRSRVMDILLFEPLENDFGGLRSYLYATNPSLYETKYSEKLRNYETIIL